MADELKQGDSNAHDACGLLSESSAVIEEGRWFGESVVEQGWGLFARNGRSSPRLQNLGLYLD